MEPGFDSARMAAPKKTHTYLYAPRETVIRTFHGEGGARETDSFISEVRGEWVSRHYESDRERRQLLWSLLGEGVRRELHVASDGDTSDPERLLRLLKSSFGEQRSATSLGEIFLNMRQGPGEFVKAYSTRLREAFDALTSRQQELGEQVSEVSMLNRKFAETLHDPFVRRCVSEHLTKTPATPFSEIRMVAENIAGYGVGAGVSQVSVTQTDMMATLLKKIESLEAQLAEVTIQQPQQNQQPHQRAPSRCFACGKPGHFARDCRNRRPNGPRRFNAHPGNGHPPQQ